MKFNRYSHLEGRHALLSPSSYSWLRYTEDQLAEKVTKQAAHVRGTILHAFAAQCISLGEKLAKSPKTLNLYVNDCIGCRVTPEQILYYSDNCFGTADALGFRKFRGDDRFTLSVFDLKTGVTPAKVDQLLIYCALFCLEYKFKPFDLLYDLRIYQNDEIVKYEVDPVEVAEIMDKIVSFDKYIERLKAEEEA